MRSAREIRFRLAQQAENIWLYAFPPRFSSKLQSAELPLPQPDVTARNLRGTPYALEMERVAGQILAHQLPLFGGTVHTGPHIEWRKDYQHGQVTGTSYFRFVPYLDFVQSGDHKNIWELNRHQHLVLLAQTWLLTGNSAYLTEVETQLESWFEQNPFLKGINFASALEVAFRALSWLWIDHLAGPHLRTKVRQLLWNGMFQHGHFLAANLSTYFSPNTHLLGEGVALFALGLKFPKTGWEQLGHRILSEERDRQVQHDGSHFEQSTYYHVYALDFFLFYFLLAGRPVKFEQPLRKMARFLAAINGPAGLLNFFGDDDGGRLFHPYGDRATFGRATLTTCALVFPDENFPFWPQTMPEQSDWWLGPGLAAGAQPATKNSARVFDNSGLVSIVRNGLHILIDTGPFGPGGAGHSHSDTLSFTVRSGDQELLIDPGTFTYVADPQARDEFRGSAYHNTVRLDVLDQADPTRPFRWDNKPEVTRGTFHDDGLNVYADATCLSRGIAHRRRFFLLGSQALFVLDSFTGPGGLHSIEQFWHLGRDAGCCMTILSDAPSEAEAITGWRSRCLGTKEESPVIAYRWESQFPSLVATVFLFSGSAPPVTLETTHNASGTTIRIPGGPSVQFPETGIACVSSS